MHLKVVKKNWSYGSVRSEYTSKSDQHLYNVTIDVSDLNDSYYVGFGLFGNNEHSKNYIKIVDLWLE